MESEIRRGRQLCSGLLLVSLEQVFIDLRGLEMAVIAMEIQELLCIAHMFI